MSDKTGFKINTQFAKKYDRYREKEELQRLKDRYGDRGDDDESESSESSSDDSEVELDPEIERDFYRTLSLLKKKDPKIYQKDAKFYSEDSPNTDVKPSTSKSKVKPMYLKDYERKVILEKEGKYEDEDSDSDDEEVAKRLERASSPSYMQEQKQLKESFRKFVQDSDDDDCSEGSGEGVSQLLTRRIKTQEEQDKEEADYMEWLKGQKDLDGPEEVKEMKYLRDYWNDPELDEKECFLRDYVLNKRYKDDDDEDEERIPTYEEVIQDDSEEEGEMFLVRQENFERGYNFRFEEPDAEQIKTYPRTIATSVRTKDDRRKRKREEIKERKEMEKQHKREQLKQLKNLKRNEIMEKLKLLQKLTGNDELAFNQADLEGDFDPQHHDQLMQKFFDEKYYGEQEDDKPQFEDDDAFEEHWNWDTWTGREQEEEYDDEADYDASEPHCDDQDFIMDADYDPSQHVSKKQKKKMKKADVPLMGKKKKKSHFAEVVSKDKPVFDPQEKSFEEYLDEYYKLDYEDIIDDLPCRFRYRQVLPNDFGLSTDEILGAEDRELNRWCSLKKTCMFRSDQEEKNDLKNYKIKSKNDKKKREILVSVYSDKDTEGSHAKATMGKKRRDRVKNAERRNREAEDSDTDTKMDPSYETVKALREIGSDVEEPEEFLTKKIKLEEQPQHSLPVEKEVQVKDQVKTKLAKKHKQSGGHRKTGTVGVKIGGREFSKQRLKAYGLNPKRLFFRQLGRQKRKEQQKKEKNKVNAT
ncbi:protein KRI1 homolog [Corythoichthys intestinalis]|uniref:protein KRI1 homolog n=1 Tax=Corythoichthys intestinalis TaxID=161448 RepID=UPI0025A5103D|nr:protein KRI1 homolog [Corythoichthys intestinalis]